MVIIGKAIAGVILATMTLASCVEQISGTAKSIPATPAGSSAPTTNRVPANVNEGPFKPGDDVKFDGNFVGRVNKIRNLENSAGGLPADDGNRYVGVEVDVTNSGTDTETFAVLLQAELKDPAGKVYDTTPLSGHKPDAPNGELKPQQTVSGMVVFEIPDKYTFKSGLAAGFVFVFKGGPGAGQDVEIKLG